MIRSTNMSMYKATMQRMYLAQKRIMVSDSLCLCFRLIRTIGAASTVLLKNKNTTLPLKTPSTIGVVGNDAGPNSQGINGCTDRGCNNGILAQGWGSGTAEYPYVINVGFLISNTVVPNIEELCVALGCNQDQGFEHRSHRNEFIERYRPHCGCDSC
jgi:hypothetical protein